MDYRGMQSQTGMEQFRQAQRRRGLIAGLALMLAGAGVLLWPRLFPPAPALPREGNDEATFARYVALPATPLSVHWRLSAGAPADSAAAPADAAPWSIEATLAFSAADAPKVTGIVDFYKPPLSSGKLVRVDDTHFQLTLRSR
jgi:hypothetical protein